jgi:hypothetical protein
MFSLCFHQQREYKPFYLESNFSFGISFPVSPALRLSRVGPNLVGTPRSLIIWRPIKPILKFFGLGHGWRIFLRARAQFADDFQKNPLVCGSLSLQAPYLQPFQ